MMMKYQKKSKKSKKSKWTPFPEKDDA
jgi:hypothetical protein